MALHLGAPRVARADDPPPVAPPTPVDPSRTRDADPLRADQLFQEAIQLLDEGRWREACPKFRESMAAEPSVGSLLNVAACSVREGHALQAAREYRRTLELNRSTVDVERRRNVDEQARAALQKLEATLGRVVVKLEPADATATVVLDGRSSEPLRAGETVEVEAGSHAIVATAQGYKAWSRTFDVAAGASETVTIALERAESSAPPPPAVEPPSRGLSTAGWITGLGGAGAALGGVVMLTLAAERAAQIRAECGPLAAPPVCPNGSAEKADELSTEGQALQTGGIVTLSVGGAAIATGIILLAVDAAREPEPRVRAAAGFGPGEAFFWLTASY